MADETKLDTTPPDPSPFIRTMAKDVARLTGKEGEVIASTQPVKKSAPEPGILLPEVDESQVAHKDPIPKEFKQEVLATTKEDESGVIAEKQKGASVFSSIPHAPIAVTPSVPQPTEAERKSILDRLRAKAAAAPAAPAPIQKPEPVAPAPAMFGSAPGIPPVSKESPVPPPPAPEPVYVPAPTPAPAPVVERPIPPPPPPPQPIANIPEPINLHTYKTDFADHIDEKKATTFSVLAAASDAGQSTAAPKARRSIAPIIGGVVLVVAGVGLGLGALYYVTHRPQTAKVPQVPSLVIPDEAIELSGTGEDMYSKIASLANEASVDGNVYVTYVSTTTVNQKKETVKTPLPGGYVIAQLPLHAPTILLRNLDPLSTVGVIDTGPETRAFFILRVTSYERSFAGMLAWEATIEQDLKALYPEPAVFMPVETPLATTTATTTPGKKPTPAPTTAPLVTQPRFVDVVVANHDVRALKDGQNQTILLYGYRDKSTLVIARNEDAFSALITRLTATPQ